MSLQLQKKLKDYNLLLNSKIDKISIFNKTFFVKRDDLLSQEFSGNKARKFYSLLKSDLSNYKTLSSIGGAQSNAMYSLSVLAKLKNLQFNYYTKKLPSYLKQNQTGNLKASIKNGMNLIELDADEYDLILSGRNLENELFVKQGGAESYAKDGLKKLANELNEYCKNFKNPKAVISCGTGTSALYLSEFFNGKVYAVPCVGDKEYLIKQFDMLDANAKKPHIITPSKKYNFAKPYIEIYEIYKELLNAGIEFDLLYDCVAWLGVKDNSNLFDDETIFVHSGGVLGNESMLARYEHIFKTSEKSDV